MSVPPPAGGLGSNSNYILTSQCNNVTGLTVTINVTQNIVHQDSSGIWYSGFGFQLNCNSAPGFFNAWQQFIFIVLGTPIGDPQINLALADYTASADSIYVDYFGVLVIPNLVLSAGYQLQMRLKNDVNDNIVGVTWIVTDLGFLPAPNTPITGYWSPSTNPNTPTLTQQHISYIGIDAHIHERLHYPSYNWVDNDLTQLSGNGIAPAAGSALDAYFGPDNGEHVNFIGTDGHVRELYLAFGGQWVNNDLTQLSKGILPLPNSPLDGYVDADDGQHVNFIGTDSHVRELYIAPHGHWVNNDLIHLSGDGIGPSRTSSLCGYLGPDGGQHVNFIGTDGQVHELYITPHGHWVNNNLNQLSGNSTVPAAGSALHSYAQPDGEQHVNFISAGDAHLHELYIRPSHQWVNNDLNRLQLVNHTTQPLPLETGQFAPINAFQVNLVSPINSDSAVLSAGAGTITYSARTPLTVQNSIPSCTASQFGTAETANSFYGSLDAGPSNLITQTFSTSSSQPIIHFHGPVPGKGLTLPLELNKPLKPIRR